MTYYISDAGSNMRSIDYFKHGTKTLIAMLVEILTVHNVTTNMCINKRAELTKDIANNK